MFEFESSGSFNPADESHSEIFRSAAVWAVCLGFHWVWEKNNKSIRLFRGESGVASWQKQGSFCVRWGLCRGARLPRGGWQDGSVRWERGCRMESVCRQSAAVTSWEQSGRFMRGETETRFKTTAMFPPITLWEIEEEEKNRFCKIVPDPVQIYWLSEGACFNLSVGSSTFCCDFLVFSVLRSLLWQMFLAAVLSGYLWRPQVRGRS